LLFYFERDQSGEYECYVLEDRGRILGILCLQIQQDSLYLSRLGVMKGQAGKGYGMRLLMATLERAIESGKKKLTCKVHKDSWEFFEGMGFKKLYEYPHPHWGLCALLELKLG
jgi:N-acetylglutamate synthase-like GNAT family acetyltransferase